MLLDPQNCNVVILGAWNTAIFTPEWVTELLKPEAAGETLTMRVGLTDAGMVIQFTAKDLALAVAPGQLTITPCSDSEASDVWLPMMEAAALKVVGALPHTPLRAVGINLRLVGSVLTPALEQALLISEGTALAAAGFEIEHVSVGRRLRYGDPEVIRNVKLSRASGGDVVLDINHHREVGGAQDVITKLDGAVRKDLEVTMRLVAEVYGEGHSP